MTQLVCRPLSLCAAALTTLCACGGSEPTAVASHVQAQAVVRDQVPVQLETPAYGCVRQVRQALKAKALQVNADCLAGTYAGFDLRNKACAVHVAANNGNFRFAQADSALTVAPETPVAAGSRSPVHAVELSADAESTQIALQLSRRSAERPGDVETLVVAAGESRQARLELLSASFTRVRAGDVTIMRCNFDT